MKPLSPVDAIAPSFSRMRTIVAPPAIPFRFAFFLKIAAVAALTNAGFYGAGVGFGMQGMGLGLRASGAAITHRHSYFVASSGTAAVLVTAVVLAGAIALALSILFGWLCCRLRFTLFDLVVYRGGKVALAWSKYSRQSWRYFGLMFLMTLALLLLLVSMAGPLFLHLFTVIRHMNPQQINTNPLVIFELILPLYGVMALFGLVATTLDAVTQDFLLPPIAIEDAPLESAFGRFFDLLRARFWSVVAYLLLRFVIAIGLTWAGLMAVFLVLFVLGLGGAGIGFVLYRSLWHLGGASAILFVLYCVFAGLILLALYLLAMICVYGIVALFKQCYAAYYYGSFYQQLGNRLEPPEEISVAIPVVPPPAMPPGLESPPSIW